MRPSRHEGNLIHPWVFIQERVWVDTHGVEHEIALMEDGYVANVIAFCRREVRKMRPLVEAYSMSELWRGLKTGYHDDERAVDWRRRDRADDLAWLEATPLMRALRARLGDPSEKELAKLIKAAREAYEARQAAEAV